MDSAALRENFAIDFRDGALYPPYVISVTGLSRAEKWGRWSDGKSVSVRFASCLPDGPIEVLLTANAFGPNVESPILVRVGENAARFRLSAHTADVSIVVPHDSSVSGRGSHIARRSSAKDDRVHLVSWWTHGHC